MCNEIQTGHDTLLGLLPEEEVEKHVVWYKAKMLSVNEFMKEVAVWLTNGPDANMDNKDNTTVVEEEVQPADSVSNMSPVIPVTAVQNVDAPLL